MMLFPKGRLFTSTMKKACQARWYEDHQVYRQLVLHQGSTFGEAEGDLLISFLFFFSSPEKKLKKYYPNSNIDRYSYHGTGNGTHRQTSRQDRFFGGGDPLPKPFEEEVIKLREEIQSSKQTRRSRR